MVKQLHVAGDTGPVRIRRRYLFVTIQLSNPVLREQARNRMILIPRAYFLGFCEGYSGIQSACGEMLDKTLVAKVDPR